MTRRTAGSDSSSCRWSRREAKRNRNAVRNCSAGCRGRSASGWRRRRTDEAELRRQVRSQAGAWERENPQARSLISLTANRLEFHPARFDVFAGAKFPRHRCGIAAGEDVSGTMWSGIVDPVEGHLRRIARGSSVNEMRFGAQIIAAAGIAPANLHRAGHGLREIDRTKTKTLRPEIRRLIA